MRKIVVFLCLILPFVAVKAQTFQRKTRQPAFFMPQSALSTQQQERLPAIENMNYQGQRPTSVRYEQQEKNNALLTETKPVSDTRAQTKTKAQIKNEPIKITEKAVKQAENPKITAQNKEKVKSINTSDNYQETFAQILNRHKADLIRIRQGDYAQSADITAMIESYKPHKNTISARVNPRSVVIK